MFPRPQNAFTSRGRRRRRVDKCGGAGDQRSAGQCPPGTSREAEHRAAQAVGFAAAIVGPGRTSSFLGLWSRSRGGYRSPRGNAGVSGEQRYSPCLRRGGNRGADVRPPAGEAGLEVSSSRGRGLGRLTTTPSMPCRTSRECHTTGLRG